MGMDLSMVQTPSYAEIPDHYPDDIRKCPGYFRGVPYDYLDEAGLLDRATKCPKGPAWPPAGLPVERAEQLRDFFDPPSRGYSFRQSDPVPTLAELKPTPRELRIIQRYIDQEYRVRSAVSKNPGKVPAFKFGSNDGWHVVPQECLVIACRLSTLLTKKEARTHSAPLKPAEMCLDVRGEYETENPAFEQVLEAINELDHADQAPFLNLIDRTQPNAFMAVWKASARSFIVEYAEGKPQQQYRSKKTPRGKVIELFARYLRRDESFKMLTEWEDITEEYFGDARRQLAWVRGFIAFNELAAKYGGYEVW
jgi:hypothetical protein